jgi:hypothetical protein
MKMLRSQDLLWVLPLAAALGAALAATQPGSFWIGWAGFAVLLGLGSLALLAAVRWGGGGRTLAT